MLPKFMCTQRATIVPNSSPRSRKSRLCLWKLAVAMSGSVLSTLLPFFVRMRSTRVQDGAPSLCVALFAADVQYGERCNFGRRH